MTDKEVILKLLEGFSCAVMDLEYLSSNANKAAIIAREKLTLLKLELEDD
jgi:hypothetical protein